MKVGDKVKIIGSHTIDGKHRIGLIGEILDIDWRDETCFVLYPKGQAWVKRTDLEVIESINSLHPEATICGWVARTQNGTLGLCRIKPERRCGDWWISIAPEDSAIYRLPHELFPDITWESDPLQVEITIRPKKQC